MSIILKDIENCISDYGSSHILIHSDLFRGFELRAENRRQLLEAHWEALKTICRGLDIVMPTFNYDFCGGKPFDVGSTPSQVGVLSEHLRTMTSAWRSSTPVFSFSGTGANPIGDPVARIDPFDTGSMFGILHRNKGLLMHYGSKFHTTTLLHYVERISGNLIYRYNKDFSGKVIDINGKEFDVTLVYHVRPKNLELDYDWVKIEMDLIDTGLIQQFSEGRTRIILGSIDKIVDFWLYRLKNEPFYFLSTSTFKRIAEHYSKLDRPFLISDFE